MLSALKMSAKGMPLMQFDGYPTAMHISGEL